MAKKRELHSDSIQEEEKLRDGAARAYCFRLAQQIRDYETRRVYTDEERAAFTSAWVRAFRDEPVEPTASIEQIAVLLYRNPRAQARIATLIEYPPGKWLLEQELAARGEWPPDDPFKDAFIVAAELNLTGICFSGGGIRSATFNLGILQGLAAVDRLNSFDYLSTVSGGSYIHQFLASWISCEDIEKVKKQLRPLPGPPSLSNFWPEPMHRLQRYAEYLGPQKGLLFADTWLFYISWLRNTFFNLIVFASALACVLIIPHFYLDSSGRLASFLLRHSGVGIGIIMMGFLVASAAIFFTQITNSSNRFHPVEEAGLGIGGVISFTFLPILISTLAFCPYLYYSTFCTVNLQTLHAIQDGCTIKWWNPGFIGQGNVSSVFPAMLGGVVLLVLSMSRGVPNDWRRFTILLAVLGSAVTGWLVLNLSRLSMHFVLVHLPASQASRAGILLCPVLSLAIVFLSFEIGVGLVGNFYSGLVRDWFARLRSYVMQFGIVWLIFSFVSLFSTGLILYALNRTDVKGYLWAKASIWLGWIGTTVASVLLGKSPFINGTSKGQRSRLSKALNIVVYIGPLIFVLGLATSVEHWTTEVQRMGLLHRETLVLTLILLAGISVLFCWRTDLNEFSFHAFYRDRLARCYSGAGNPDRRPNRFTGFAASDMRLRLTDLLPTRFNGPSLRDLWAPYYGPDSDLAILVAPQYQGPFPIFCSTVNLSFGQDLGYRDDKRASFAFTPLYCGYDVNWTETDSDRVQFNGYAPTSTFAFAGGPLLATAVAASGAADSPYWGYHSNPLIAFFLAVFNVRLGLWIRNSRHKRFRLRNRRSNSSSPWFGLYYLLAELFGMVNDEAAFVYLTDGGHFENIGLYELVRRHCSTIVICDAEQDGNSFQGIGMAIRKCRIDHGAEIFLDITQFETTGDPPASPQSCIAGTVRYSNGAVGQVLYIKSTYTRELPADLVNFRKENPTFPNGSISDERFSESQFESYRRLGQHYARSERVLAWLERHVPVRPSTPPEQKPPAQP